MINNNFDHTAVITVSVRLVSRRTFGILFDYQNRNRRGRWITKFIVRFVVGDLKIFVCFMFIPKDLDPFDRLKLGLFASCSNRPKIQYRIDFIL